MTSEITLIGFDRVSSTVVSEIRRNLRALLATPAGSCGGDRSYGISTSCLDLPLEAAKNMIAAEIIAKTAIYEPRVELTNLDSTVTDTGLVNHCEFSPADYDDES